MANFGLSMKKARKRSKEEKAEARERFKEILAIVKKYNVKDGLTPEMTVDILQDLGPTFVKIGQIASTNSDIIPPEYCEALSKLTSNVAPMDAATVHAQIEEHLGKPLEGLGASERMQLLMSCWMVAGESS